MVNKYIKGGVLLLFLWVMLVSTGFSAEITSVANGNWSNAGTWDHGVPKTGDNVVIEHAVTIDQGTQVIGSLVISTGGQLLAGTGVSELRLSGLIVNDGILNLYSGPAAYTDLTLSGDSYWFGPGTWTLASLKLGAAVDWTFADGIQVYINKDIIADETSSINDLFGAPTAELIFTGSESSVTTSLPTAFYPVLVIDKTAGATVSLSDSEGINVPQMWLIVIQKATDVLNIGANNILELYQDDLGPGFLSGAGSAESPSRITNNYSSAQTALRVKSGRIKLDTDLEVIGDVSLDEAGAFLDVSGRTLTGGGSLNGDGFFISDESSQISFLNIGALVKIRFTAGSSVDVLEFNRANQNGTSEVVLRDNLRIAGELRNLPPLNKITVGAELEIAGNYIGNGTLGGSSAATLLLTGDGSGLILPMSGSFKQVQVSRNTGVTFRNVFQITDELNFTGPVALTDGVLSLGSTRSSSGRLTMGTGTSLDLGNGEIHFTGSTAITIPAGCYISGSDAARIRFSGPRADASLRFDTVATKSRLKSLVVAKPNSVITLESPVSVVEKVTVNGTNSTLSSNGFLSLVSTAAGSASVDPIPGSSKITGLVRVERFISGGPKDPYRGYRMLSSPVYDHTTEFTTENRTSSFRQYKDDIYVTGPNPAGDFDVFAGNPNNSTIWTYDEPALTSSGLDYVGINSIDDAIPAGQGAMIFFRGARINPGGKLKAPYDHPESVTMDFEGVLNQGPVTVTLPHTSNNEATDGYFLLGNPYAATLDWNSAGWTKSNITGQIWIYNPASKQYAIFDGENGTNGGNQYIAPGQAFFVKTTSEGSITFNESVKVSKKAGQDFPLFMSAPLMAASFSAEGPIVMTNPDKEKIRIRLVRNGNIADEALIVFRGGSKAEFTVEDARDMHGEQVFLSTLSADSVQLGINYMPPAVSVERVGMYASASSYGYCTLEFPEVATSGKVSAFLADHFLGKKIPLRPGAAYPFEITADQASYGSGRFELLFQKVKPPIPVSSFTGRKSGGGVKLEWTAKVDKDLVPNVVFQLERSTDGVTFTKIAEVPASASGQPVPNYSYLDKDPVQGQNSYRLKTLFEEGSEAVSDIVTIIFDLISGGNNHKSRVYPNPADSGITIFLDNAPKAEAVLHIYDKSGKKVISRELGLIAGDTEIAQSVSQLKQGIYFVEILDVKKNKQVFSSKLIKQ